MVVVVVAADEWATGTYAGRTLWSVPCKSNAIDRLPYLALMERHTAGVRGGPPQAPPRFFAPRTCVLEVACVWLTPLACLFVCVRAYACTVTVE